MVIILASLINHFLILDRLDNLFFQPDSILYLLMLFYIQIILA